MPGDVPANIRLDSESARELNPDIITQGVALDIRLDRLHNLDAEHNMFREPAVILHELKPKPTQAIPNKRIKHLILQIEDELRQKHPNAIITEGMLVITEEDVPLYTKSPLYTLQLSHLS